jgi:B12-binding domain/radical SAM domain protein
MLTRSPPVTVQTVLALTSRDRIAPSYPRFTWSRGVGYDTSSDRVRDRVLDRVSLVESYDLVEPCDLVVVLRYRKAVTYGLHVLLGALDSHQSPTRYQLRFAPSAAATATEISAALRIAPRVLVLWSFYSPDAPAMAAELASIRATVDSPAVTHLAGGVHASAEPWATLNAGWDLVAIGEGENTLLELVDAQGRPEGIAGLAWIDQHGELVRTGRPDRHDLDSYPGFSLRWNRFNALEITRGCAFTCSYCQTPFMFSARFRHRSVANVRWHVDQMAQRGLRDVRFITPSALSYGSPDDQPNLAAVEQLLASCKQGIGEYGRIFLGSFPSEIRPEHLTSDALRLVRRYCANDNIIVGAQSGSDRMLELAKRGHRVEDVRRAVRLGVSAGFTVNVDIIFGMPGEEPADVTATLALIEELATVGARINAHTFMPLPGTPWRDAPPGEVSPKTGSQLDRYAQRGALYGHWQRQRERASELARAARHQPRGVGRRRRASSE